MYRECLAECGTNVMPIKGRPAVGKASHGA